MLKLWLLIGCLSLELFSGNNAHQLPHCFELHDDTCPNSNITLWFYSNEDPFGRKLDSNCLDDFIADPARPLKILIHGFNGDLNTSPNREVLPQLLNIPDINIIAVDYSNLVPDPCYTQAVNNAHYVGRCLAEFVSSLLSVGLVLQEQLHLIGFGLGAHVAAFVSNNLAENHLRVGHITGLDPAKPLFLTPNLAERLDRSDADFVDIIHSDIFLHGLLQPIGHVDFYPNKGVVQPQCGPITNITTHECYHRRSAEYYAESIYTSVPFWGFRCADLYVFITGECLPNNDIEPLGYHTRKEARGNYFLATNEFPPYAKGYDFSNLDRSLIGKTYLGDDLINKLGQMGPEVRKLTVEIG